VTIEELLEIEQIRALRNAYSACFDSQDVAGLADLFCDDAVCEFPEQFGGNWVGKETIVGNFVAQMKAIGEPFDAIHVVTNPWITLTGPDTAHGRCYLIDLLTRQRAGTAEMTTRGGHENPLLFLGMYEDDYRKVDGSWKFANIRLPFFWPDRTFDQFKHQRSAPE
jgi:ketosteroid isomerase-like protein